MNRFGISAKIDGLAVAPAIVLPVAFTAGFPPAFSRARAIKGSLKVG